MSLKQYILAALCCLPSVCWAGQITLKSGDSVSGSLLGIEGDAVQWQSPELGKLNIKKNNIKSIKADNPMKIRGKSVPCVCLAITEEENLAFQCADGSRPSFPLLSLKHVVPFEDHAATNFGFSGNVRASGWRQSGNTRGEYWEAKGKVNLRHADIRHGLDTTVEGQQTEVTDELGNVSIALKRHYLSTYSLDWFFLPQWYWSNKISGERDDNRNIQEEYTVGSGLGYQFWETQKTALSLESGLEFSTTYLRNNPLPNEPEEFTSVRIGTSYRYTLPRGWKFFHKNEYTYAIDGVEDGKADRWKIKTDSGLHMPIGFGISASVSLKWDFINYARDLDPNASRKDSTYRVGVNYAW